MGALFGMRSGPSSAAINVQNDYAKVQQQMQANQQQQMMQQQQAQQDQMMQQFQQQMEQNMQQQQKAQEDALKNMGNGQLNPNTSSLAAGGFFGAQPLSYLNGGSGGGSSRALFLGG